MKVSVVIPCKNRLEHLKRSLPLVLAQSYKDLEVLVVDYNCPQNSGEWAKTNNSVRVVNCNVGIHEWSLSAARNTGFKHITGDIVLFLDADALLVDVNFIDNHVKHLVEGSFICGWGYGDATGCMMCYSNAFIAINGYNELIQSWGAEDIIAYNKFQQELGIEKRVWLGGIETIEHSDEIRNYYHGGKNIWETNEENFKIEGYKGLR